MRIGHYPVPVRSTGRKVRVPPHSSEPVFFDGLIVVARSERLVARGECRPEPDHSLETPVRKPGALCGSTALEQSPAPAGPLRPGRGKKPRAEPVITTRQDRKAYR